VAIPAIPEGEIFGPPRGFRPFRAFGAFLIIAVYSFLLASGSGSLGLKLFFGAIQLFIIAYAIWWLSTRRVMTVDEKARRIRIHQSSFGRPYKTLLDVSFGECESAGLVTLRYAAEPCIQMKDGRTYQIPYDDRGFPGRSRRLAALSRFLTLTGLPHVDRE
jgi:hypothetical protein